MTGARTPAARGRPATITRERIADAGIHMTVPKITFVGIAALLGVSQVALYKHVPNLEALRQQVAEAIFERWEIPPTPGPVLPLADYLMVFSASLRELLGGHPGLAPYLVRRGAKSPAMVAKILAHHAAIAQAYGMAVAEAGWMLSTVAFHCVALADTVYARPADADHAQDGRTPPAAAHEDAAIEAEFTWGMRALVAGLFVLREERARSLPVA